MGQDFFKFLPSEIILNILSRLPTQTTMSCKCVCKSWLYLLTTPEFVSSHLSKSAPCLAVFDFTSHSKPYKIVELVDEHRWNTVLSFDLPFNEPVHSSVNGVLFLGGNIPGPLILCNPITREYFALPSPRKPSSELVCQSPLLETYGFGVSRMTGEYKVVRIFVESKPPYGCQVYTVGTGLWRRISIGSLTHVDYTKGAFVNGNLHWMVKKLFSRRISCLDLETELFTSFALPHPLDEERVNYNENVSVLCGCLSVCDIRVDYYHGYEIEIWLMKEYGDEASWAKGFIIRKANFPDAFVDDLCPIKVFEDGDILMEWGGIRLLHFTSKSKRTRKVYSSATGRRIACSTALYAPSFLPLKAFAAENISSF